MLSGEILTELLNSPPKNIPFYQNADSRFLMNTMIRSIITYFQVANIGISVKKGSFKFSNNLDFLLFESVCDLQILRAWNMIPKVLHDFMDD